MRQSISSWEELWVRICYRFFERHSFWEWYRVPKNQAFHEMMKDSNGQANPKLLKEKIDELYDSIIFHKE